MKRVLSAIIAMIMLLGTTACSATPAQDGNGQTEIMLQIGNSMMTVDGNEQEIDPGRGTVPIIVNGRTLVPVRAIIEAMGGTVGWDGETETATLNMGDDEIKLIIDSTTAYLNGAEKMLDVAPAIINERTMLPIRFIAESFHFTVEWIETEQKIIIRKESKNETTASSHKILIAYFSRAGENWQVGYVDKGNTAVIEEYIENKIDADVFEIKASEPYPESYEETLTRVNRERDNNERPQFEGEISDLDQYDTVFLGYPIWYGGLPMIMYTFLEEYDMSEKTIIPFSTHGGSGWGSTLTELKELCPDSTFKDGFSTAGTNARSAKDDVEKWIDGLGLDTMKMNTEEAAVLAAFEKIQQAMVYADVDTIDRMIKDGKTFTHMSGKVQTKEEYFADIKSSALDYKSYTVENPSVTIKGKYAKLTALTTLTANAYGAQGSWPFNTTAWFEKINGDWIYCNEPSKNASEAGNFDIDKGIVTLNSGYEMPILGIGTYQLSNAQAENSVYWALRDGYRLIDTARIYGNEEGVGKGIKKAIDEGFVTREEIFVTTKMWTSDFDNGDAAINASLKRLDIDYIDLMILHHSQPRNDVKAYQAMEKAVSDGRLRSIGLSNYYTPDDFDRLVNATNITPALLQNETHPYHQSKEMKDHLEKYGTVMESWFPLGGRGNTQTLFNDETISSIAKVHNKTSAQVILRWHLQAGNIAIPGSSNEGHIGENFEIFDFELSKEEMQRLTDIDKNERFADY